MALVPCRECGKEVSEGAKVCPSCGIKTPSQRRRKMKMFAAAGVAIALVGGSGLAYHSLSSTSDTKAGIEMAQPKIQADKPVKEQILQKDYKEKVGEMLDSGKSVGEISKETGLKRKEIRKIKKEKKETN